MDRKTVYPRTRFPRLLEFPLSILYLSLLQGMLGRGLGRGLGEVIDGE